MKKNNNFDAFDKPDDFDEMLFNYFDKKDENIPLSTQNTIKNALKNTHKQKNISFTMLKRIAIFIICFGIIIATTVYAKDIINFLTSIFTNSNAGIDTAVENGYVQNVDMDFIECNNVGVKVDYILMDDHNLDISFVYKYYEGNTETKFDNISFNNISIIDENNNVLFWLSEDTIPNHNLNLINTTAQFNNVEKISDGTTYRSSLLLTSENMPVSHILTISINEIKLISNKKLINVDGNWSFSINLDNKFANRINNEYSYISNSSYVNSVVSNVSETSLILELNLNVLLDESKFLNPSNIVLYDKNNNYYNYTKINCKNISTIEPYNSIITITYPITIYDDIDFLNLHINLSAENFIDVEIFK